MHEQTLIALEDLRARQPNHPVLKIAPAMAHFVIPSSVDDLAWQIGQLQLSDVRGEGGIAFPADARLPKQWTSFVFEGCDLSLRPKNAARVYIAHEENGFVFVEIITNDGRYVVAFSFKPGTDDWSYSEDIHRMMSLGEMFAFVWKFAFVLSLINTPRLIEKRNEAPKRHIRRRAERLFNVAFSDWVTVQWTIGKASQARSRNQDVNHGIALHWRRAHWSKAKAGEPKAEWIRDRHSGEFGWFRWVSDCWVGHPDFGIRLHNNRPCLEGRVERPGGSAPFAAAMPGRIAAFNAATQAALQEAGFA